jgi:hypothetical protein
MAECRVSRQLLISNGAVLSIAPRPMTTHLPRQVPGTRPDVVGIRGFLGPRNGSHVPVTPSIVGACRNAGIVMAALPRLPEA